MNSPHLLPTAAVLAFALTATAADAVTPVEIRYRFAPDQTNAYRVSFETTVGEQTSTLAGVVFVHVRKVEDGVATLGFRGNVTPLATAGQPPMLGVPYHPFGGPWRPGPITLHPNSEIRVDELGQVVRQSSYGPELPAPFGSVMGLFFHAVPGAAGAEWQSTADVLIEDETAANERPGRYFGPYGDARSGYQLAARRTAKTRLTATADAAVTVESRVEVASWLKSGGEPRLKAISEGVIVLDRKTGWVRSAEYRSQSVTTTVNLMLRRPMSLSVRLLEGDELKRELAALTPADAPPPKITSAELPCLLRDLESVDETTRMTAINRFQVGEVEEVTAELLAAAVKLSGSPDYPERAAAGHLLGRYGTSEQVPAMLKLVAWSQPGNQREVLEALGRLKDPRAIVPLTDLIARGNYESDFVVQMLQHFGPVAETAALNLFKERHTQTRRLACVLLGEVGTRKSTDTLREQMLDPEEQVAQAATQALRAIQQRESDLVPAQ